MNSCLLNTGWSLSSMSEDPSLPKMYLCAEVTRGLSEEWGEENRVFAGQHYSHRGAFYSSKFWFAYNSDFRGLRRRNGREPVIKPANSLFLFPASQQSVGSG